jgi:hypothetical protein
MIKIRIQSRIHYIEVWIPGTGCTSKCNGSATLLLTSVADPGSLLQILIFTHPGSRIVDTKTPTRERGEQNPQSFF